MGHDYRKVNQLIGWLLLVLAVCFSSVLIMSESRGAVDPAQTAASTAAVATGLAAPERASLGETLSGLLLCGEWPVAGSALSAGRGNPFEPKKTQLRLFAIPGISDLEAVLPTSSCRTVQEVLNK